MSETFKRPIALPPPKTYGRLSELDSALSPGVGTHKMARVWCGPRAARRASCTAMASGCTQPASSHETPSGMGTAISARHVKRRQSVPSVGSSPQ